MNVPLSLKEQRAKDKAQKIQNRLSKFEKNKRLGGTKKQRNQITSDRGQRIVNGRVNMRPLSKAELTRIVEASYEDGKNTYDLVSSHRVVLKLDELPEGTLSEVTSKSVNDASQRILAACEEFKTKLTDHYNQAKEAVDALDDDASEVILTGLNISVVLPLGDMFQVWGMEVMDAYTDLMTAIQGDF